MAPFNPKNQTFLIAGEGGKFDFQVSMAQIDALRVKHANICISWGVQLGLSLMMLITLLLLLPGHKMKKSVHVVHISSLLVAVVRLNLLLNYFPGPLSEYYVMWTQDASALKQSDYYVNTTANSFNVIQLAFILTALVQQSWGLVASWPETSQYLVKALSVSLAIATIVLKSIWVVHHSMALRTRTLPVPLGKIGVAATVVAAVSIFYFCGVFFLNLSLHLGITRGIIKRTDRRLTSLEILALGNGILMVLPSKSTLRILKSSIKRLTADNFRPGVFAGLDIAAGISGTRVLPFDAGSWVQTLLVVGLPLVGLTARYRGPVSQQLSRRMSHFVNGPVPILITEDTTLGSNSFRRSAPRDPDPIPMSPRGSQNQGLSSSAGNMRTGDAESKPEFSRNLFGPRDNGRTQGISYPEPESPRTRNLELSTSQPAV
jgi:pheromone alpha factor receptor